MRNGGRRYKGQSRVNYLLDLKDPLMAILLDLRSLSRPFVQLAWRILYFLRYRNSLRNLRSLRTRLPVALLIHDYIVRRHSWSNWLAWGLGGSMAGLTRLKSRLQCRVYHTLVGLSEFGLGVRRRLVQQPKRTRVSLVTRGDRPKKGAGNKRERKAVSYKKRRYKCPLLLL